jgi:hypothetical protein
MASLTTSVGNLAVVTSGLPQLVVASVPGVPRAIGTSQGATGVEVVGTSPQQHNDARSLLQDKVMRDTGVGVLGSAARVMWPQPPGPHVPWVWGYLDCTYWALPSFCLCPLTRGKWGMKQSLRVHGLLPWRGCCIIH